MKERPVGRGQVEITGTSWHEVDDVEADDVDTPGSPSSLNFDWQTVENRLLLTRTCPASTEMPNTKYTVDGDKLTLYVLDEGVMFGELFERQ